MWAFSCTEKNTVDKARRVAESEVLQKTRSHYALMFQIGALIMRPYMWLFFEDSRISGACKNKKAYKDGRAVGIIIFRKSQGAGWFCLH